MAWQLSQESLRLSPQCKPLGTPHSAEARAKMSAAHKRRGSRPPKAGRPWTAEEEALLRRLPPAEAARRTGRTLKAVYAWRRVLGVPDGRRRRDWP